MKFGRLTPILFILSLATPLPADDLTGSKSFLCTAGYAAVCLADGDCTGGPAWNLNIPQFIEVDLDSKTLRTTRASRHNRTTEIKKIERLDGQIVLHGAEQGRAFSWVINEETGTVTVAVATDGKGVVAFGVCTPLDRLGRR